MENLHVYCTLVTPAGLPAWRDVAAFEELAARLLLTWGELFGSKRRVQRLLLHVIDTSTKSRCTSDEKESPAQIIIVEKDNSSRGRLRKSVRSKTLRVDW